MSDRREFKRSVRVEIIKRAKDTILGLACEKCGNAVKRFEIHHLEQDAMQTDKSRALVASDGLLVCLRCHKKLNAHQAPILAKVLAVEARHLGADKSKSPMRTPAKERKPALVTAPGQPGWARRIRNG